MDAVVLVHGAFVDGTSWTDVADGLRSRGHRVETPSLHQGSLTADTARVQALIDAIGEPVVVCGWSYGGMVVTGLRLPEGSHLVYLCAVMPAEGESMWSLAGQAITDLRDEIDVELETDEAGDLVVSGSDVDLLFWGDAPADTKAVVNASMRPQVADTFFEAPAIIGWRTMASTYVIGSRDRVFGGDLAMNMAARADTKVTWDTDHSPNLCRPDLVIDLLAELATRRTGGV
jgi:pimeloyl-ACP methyl ester carboxylesterase